MDSRDCASLGQSAMADGHWRRSRQISLERGRQSLTPARSWKGKPTMTREIPKWEWKEHAHQTYPIMYFLSPQRASNVPIVIDRIVSVLSTRNNTNKTRVEIDTKLSWESRKGTNSVCSIHSRTNILLSCCLSFISSLCSCVLDRPTLAIKAYLQAPIRSRIGCTPSPRRSRSKGGGQKRSGRESQDQAHNNKVNPINKALAKASKHTTAQPQQQQPQQNTLRSVCPTLPLYHCINKRYGWRRKRKERRKERRQRRKIQNG